MKIISVSLSKTIPTGAYANVKIGMEGTIDEGENPLDGLDRLKRLIDAWYINEYPPTEPISVVSQWDANYKSPPSTLTTTSGSQPIEINIQDEKISIAIENADNLDELAEVKVKYPVMKVPINDAWNKKLDELLANSTKNFVNGFE
jgi:hypothetical protein